MINKKLNLTIFLLSLLMVVGSYYLELVLGLVPCPLCMMQRFCAILLTVLTLITMLSEPQKRLSKICWGLFVTVNVFAIYFAARQLYLQAFPDEHLACAPGFEALLEYFPYQDILYALFWGSGDCAKITWRFLGGSLAFWSFLSFDALLMLFILGRYQKR